MAITTKGFPKIYRNVEDKDYSIYDKLVTRGSYINTKFLIYDSKMKTYKGRWEKPNGKKKFLAKLLTFTSLGIFGIIFGCRKKYLESKLRKWGSSGYKNQVNENNKRIVKTYEDLVAQGKNTKEFDKVMGRLAKRLPIENTQPYADSAAMRDGGNLNSLALKSQEEINARVEADNLANEENKLLEIAHYTATRQNRSTLGKGEFVDAKTKDIVYVYDHFDHAEGYAEVNTDKPETVAGGGAQFNCVRAKVNILGAIDFSLEENKPLLENKIAVNTVIKAHPESILTLPKEYIERLGAFSVDSVSKKVTSTAADIKELFAAFKEGVAKVSNEGLSTGVCYPGTGKRVAAESYKETISEKLFQKFEAQTAVSTGTYTFE